MMSGKGYPGKLINVAHWSTEHNLFGEFGIFVATWSSVTQPSVEHETHQYSLL